MSIKIQLGSCGVMILFRSSLYIVFFTLLGSAYLRVIFNIFYTLLGGVNLKVSDHGGEIRFTGAAF